QRDQTACSMNANQLSVAKAAATAFRPRTPPPGAVDAIEPVPTTATAAQAPVRPAGPPPAAVVVAPRPVVAAAPIHLVPEGATPDESREALVRTVQTLLVERGYDPGPVDGLAGPKTIQAIRAFQRSIGAASDGRIDGALVTKLSQRIG
ncbi:MAG: peptidoglycan-binding protein, partial [Rhizobiales bacterium]|nr:peptidoglycan-binding protein [Hyphomicrobiales bacterium]